MILAGRLSALGSRVAHPRTTVRWRLTLLYGGLFLASGAALLAITYTLVAHATVTNGPISAQIAVRNAALAGPPPGSVVSDGPRLTFPATRSNPPTPRSSFTRAGAALPAPLRGLLRSTAGRDAVRWVVLGQRISDLHQLVIESGIALAIMAAICAALGWLVAGRVLHPLRTMTTATQQISAANLNQRLAMVGPPDELRKLADTIDGLLARLEGAFEAQRRFVANASHELRTPLTAVRALLEMVAMDPDATIETYRQTCQQVLEENEQQEQLIEALLALAHGQRGVDRREPVALERIAADALQAVQADAGARGVRLEAQLREATVTGDRRLLELLTCNLVENAVRHNVADGTVALTIAQDGGRATLTLANTGQVIPADECQRLLQPFQRMTAPRAGHSEGFGLGLSIVAAIAGAHDATLLVAPLPGGGLHVQVGFPPGAGRQRHASASPNGTSPQHPSHPPALAA
ncbi:MAG: HAMP domain-containing sensor histidine kinase [Solirubrobacteraceae bacterium]